MLFLGADIGGTKTEIVVLDSDGREILRHRQITPHGDYGAALDGLAAAILAAERDAGGRCSVGVGVPGTASPAGGRLENAYSTPYNGHVLASDLGALLHREVRIANDANCFALSEAVDGAGRLADTVLGVILGTGAGSGIVVRGRIVAGANGIAGEIGHVPLPWMRSGEFPGPECYCGRRGCIERFVSGPAMAQDHLDATGETTDPEKIVTRAAGGDPHCAATLDRYEDRLARALALAINIIDPDVIVLGGGLSSIESLYRNVPARWGRYIYSTSATTRLLPPVHGDASGVRGAAWLWPRQS